MHKFDRASAGLLLLEWFVMKFQVCVPVWIGISVALGCAPARAAPSASSDATTTLYVFGVVNGLSVNPSDARSGLQAAINRLGVSTTAAMNLVSLFADHINDVAACDPDQARELAKALAAVLSDPANAALAAEPAVEQIVAELNTDDIGGPIDPDDPGTSPLGVAGLPPGGAFGSFGSPTGTAVATSPAT